MLKIARLLTSKGLRLISLGLAMLLFTLVLSITHVLQAAPVSHVAVQEAPFLVFSKIFVPDTIGSGSVSTLQFEIDNRESDEPATDLTFTDVLPNGVTIAAPANIVTTCPDSQVTAPDGGTTINFTGARIGASSACIVSVDVTSSTGGKHTNISGDLTSSAGNSGSATATLIVDNWLPGFTKSFSPSTIPFGGRSTLTFTIDNTANEEISVSSLAFIDLLPEGMTIADPANVSTDCPEGTLTAVPRTAVIDYASASDSSLDNGASCAISVDVNGNGNGRLGNTTSELTSSAGSSGKAAAVLTVTVDALALTKSFTDDPVPPGHTTTLEFTISNMDRLNGASNIAFTDDLDAALSGLVAIDTPLSDPCGADSQLTGTGVLTLVGGNLPAEGSCTFSVTLQAPTSAPIGAYTNTTSSIAGDVDGSPVTGSPATDLLFVQPVPALTKEFFGDPVGAGGTVTLQFVISNTSLISDATDIAFEDELTTFLPFPVSADLPLEPCGVGSTLKFISPFGDNHVLLLTDGSLAANTSCIFDIELDIPAGFPAGIYTNTTEAITAVIDGVTYTGRPASDDLVIVGAPRLLKEFTDDPVSPGDAVTLEFTITNDNITQAATNIAFTDNLDAALTGLVATGLPPNGVCGAGSQISGTTTLDFSGGTLGPGASCAFSVTLQTPPDALPGNHTNTTGNITATTSGVEAVGNQAEDVIQVTGITFTKSFADDPVIIPGETVVLQFTIENTRPTASVASISFFDDILGVLPGIAIVGPLPIEPCGAGSSFTQFGWEHRLTNGKLAPGTSCTFGVLLEVPVGTASDTYNNSTSDLTAVVDSSLVSVAPAADTLTVSSDLLLLSKTFTDDPVAPGDTATLEFTLTNVHTTQTATDIAFIDDLGAVLSGLVAIGLPANDVCGTGSQISGTNLLIFNGGNLGPGASCTFSVTLQAPGGAAAGTYTNTTSQATGLIDGLSVTGDSATDDLRVNVLTFAKSFDGPTIAGGNPILSFTIQNPSTAVSALSFVDNLDNVLSGLVATGLPVSDVCGAGSELAGTSILTMISGNLEPSATCTFSVTLQVPSGAAPGDYLNETSDLSMFGLPVSAPANATMTVNPTVYLPIILNDVTFAPDLVVTDLSVSDGNAQVVIENQGVTAVIDEFWVDVYINPIPPPTIVNQTWEQLADEGLVWGVTAGALPLAPGESLTLTINGAYYRADLSEFSGTILPGTAVYAQVDSAHTNTAYGAVMETHEMNGDPYNNIYGTTATAGMPTINWLAFTPYFMAQYGYGLSERP